VSGQSSQSGWNSWFGADGEPVEGAETKPEEAPDEAAPTQEAPTPPAVTEEEKAPPLPAVKDEEKAPEPLWQAPEAAAEPTDEPEPAPDAEAPDERDEPDGDLAAARTVTAATVLAALSDPAEPDAPGTPETPEPEVPAPTELIKTAPPEPSTWSAPPAVPSAEQETALVRPVRLDPDLMTTRFVSPPPPSADDQPTRLVPEVAPTQRVTPASNWPQPKEPAQLWGAPRDPFAQGRQEPPLPPTAVSSPYRAEPAPAPRPRYDSAPAAPQPGDDEWAGWDEDASHRRVSPPPAAGPGRSGSGNGGGRRSRRKAVLGSVSGVVVGGLVLLLVLNQTVFGGGGDKPKPTGFQPTATAPADAAKETAAAFLAAWQSGNDQKAAAFTDNPSQALSTLAGYRTNLHLAGLDLSAESSTATTVTPQAGASASATPTAGPGGTVTFSVDAAVGVPSDAAGASTSSASASASASAGGSSSAGTPAVSTTASWKYTSHLTAYEQNGGWWIQWTPGLVAPNLTADTKIVSIAIPAQADEVADSAGNTLSGAADAGLRNIAAELKKNAPVGGTPGVEIELQKADGTAVSGTADKLSEPVNTDVLKTTIDPQVETAAMNAVAKYPQSSMVVIQPSTGYILAVANNAGGNDYALTARIAPGSTNKIITSTALLTSGLLSSTSQAVECPKSIPINGMSFGNSEGESLPASTPFLEDFADSCNNAFAQWYDKIGSTTLAQTAQKYYGLNQKWDIGLGPAGPYYKIPPSTSNGELAMELFGQGQLVAAPLAMASVAATVSAGTFKQPIVVPGAAQLTATPLPSDVQQGLWKMMHAVTQSGGTAAGVFSGVSDEVYGKTGTADVDAATTQKPNSWMVVFDPKANLAIGCVVLGAGFGASFAGPETASVLKALQ
jgi:hypothetical protein